MRTSRPLPLPRLASSASMVVLLLALSVHADQQRDHFETEIRPVLVTTCVKCHGPAKQEGSLRVDTRDGLLAGGESGPAVVPGKPAESLLIEAIRYESFEMPPSGPLPPGTVRAFEAWVAAGAVWPANIGPLREARTAISAEDRNWWAFRAPHMSTPPEVEGDNWSHNGVDRFVFSRLRAQDMRPAPQADRRTLVRRLYFDLLGVPPSPDEVDAFVASTDEHAWEKLIDRLLADSRYGEHWARYWLDLVRYSESDGWNADAYRPSIWRYRDYVVRAFNEDKPYPRFVLEQLAGDEMDGDDPDHAAAVGFLRLGIYEYNQRDARGHWNDIMNEMTDVAGDVFLGVSMACARCHDHKFDPVLQADYFQLRAFFEPVVWRDDIPAATTEARERHAQQAAKWEEATTEIRERIEALLKPYHDKKWRSTVDKFPLDIQACFHKPVEQRTSWEHQMAYLVSRQFEEEGGGPLKSMSKADKQKHDVLLKELAAFDDLKPPALPSLMTVTDFPGRVSSTVIPEDPDRDVAPGFLTVLRGEVQAVPEIPRRGESTGRRTALARWIGRDDNPLTIRVIVNRIWQQHFGQGIVSTPSDFGHLGQPPSHPELLDWLSLQFVESGWSIKQLHKTILMSATWRQSSAHPLASDYQQRDPAEALMWRSRVRRLSAEQIRDAMLTISGELKNALGGPSVAETAPRRGLYVKSFRNKTETFLHAFDASAGLKSVAIRNTTTTPTQSLLMMNGPYALKRATAMAERLLQTETTPAELANSAIRAAWGRSATEDELAGAVQFLGTVDSETNRPDKERTADLCHVLMNSSEFLYVD